MCKKCHEYSKRNPPKTITRAHAKVLAHRMLKGEPVPVFSELAANMAVESWMYRIERRRSKKP